jgi:hypothetical protein
LYQTNPVVSSDNSKISPSTPSGVFLQAANTIAKTAQTIKYFIRILITSQQFRSNRTQSAKFYCKTHSITTLKDYDLINLENFIRNNFNSNVAISKGYAIKIELYSQDATQPTTVQQFALVEINGKMSVLNTDETYF